MGPTICHGQNQTCPVQKKEKKVKYVDRRSHGETPQIIDSMMKYMRVNDQAVDASQLIDPIWIVNCMMGTYQIIDPTMETSYIIDPMIRNVDC